MLLLVFLVFFVLLPKDFLCFSMVSNAKCFSCVFCMLFYLFIFLRFSMFSMFV